MLTQSDKDAFVQNLEKCFQVKFAFKIVSTEISYKIPNKSFSLKENFIGIQAIENNYKEKIEIINNSQSLKDRAYFIILESISTELNSQNAMILDQLLESCHITLSPAESDEITQLIEKF
jgi:hypothetical protein